MTEEKIIKNDWKWLNIGKTQEHRQNVNKKADHETARGMSRLTIWWCEFAIKDLEYATFWKYHVAYWEKNKI